MKTYIATSDGSVYLTNLSAKQIVSTDCTWIKAQSEDSEYVPDDEIFWINKNNITALHQVDEEGE